jgi:hypothetical protein
LYTEPLTAMSSPDRRTPAARLRERIGILVARVRLITGDTEYVARGEDVAQVALDVAMFFGEAVAALKTASVALAAAEARAGGAASGGGGGDGPAQSSPV